MTTSVGKKILDQETGQWVNQKHQWVAEIINDYDPHLRLLWIPEGLRTAGDIYPYAIGFYDNEFSEPHIVCYVMEDELNEKILAKLFSMRNAAADPNKLIDTMDAAKKILKAKADMERHAELHDKARSLWKTPLHTYRMDGKKFNL